MGGLLRAAALPLGLGGLLWPAQPVVGAGATYGSTPVCTPGECDPLCVEVGRYRATDEIVEDTRTGRIWQRRADARLPWEEAVRYCEGLTLDGQRGFELPSVKDLRAIRYEPGGLFGDGRTRHYCVPSIDQAAFPETPADIFWTSRRMPDDTAWYVDFADGRSHRDTRSEEHWVRCTRGPVGDRSDAFTPR